MQSKHPKIFAKVKDIVAYQMSNKYLLKVSTRTSSISFDSICVQSLTNILFFRMWYWWFFLMSYAVSYKSANNYSLNLLNKVQFYYETNYSRKREDASFRCWFFKKLQIQNPSWSFKIVYIYKTLLQLKSTDAQKALDQLCCIIIPICR